MVKHKINITFDVFSVQEPIVKSIIRQCIEATLDAEQISTSCEINVLVTDDKGIHAINKASRNIDRPTDVLSFPMFQLEPGNPPQEWEEYLDPETVADPVSYPADEVLANGSSYAYLPEDISRFVESLFMDVRNS